MNLLGYVCIYEGVSFRVYVYMATDQNHVPGVHVLMLSDPEGLDHT